MEPRSRRITGTILAKDADENLRPLSVIHEVTETKATEHYSIARVGDPTFMTVDWKEVRQLAPGEYEVVETGERLTASGQVAF